MTAVAHALKTLHTKAELLDWLESPVTKTLLVSLKQTEEDTLNDMVGTISAGDNAERRMYSGTLMIRVLRQLRDELEGITDD